MVRCGLLLLGVVSSVLVLVKLVVNYIYRLLFSLLILLCLGVVESGMVLR